MWAANTTSLLLALRRADQKGIKLQHKPFRSQKFKGKLQNKTREKQELHKVEPIIYLERGVAGQQPAPETLPAAAPGRTMPDSFAVHFLKVLKELLAFVLFSYTVLVGALLLAGWTTYFLVLK